MLNRQRVGLCVVLAAGLFASFGFSATAHDEKIATDAIRKTLDAQAAAWNRGDIPDFMAGYVNDPSLRFASGNAVHRGWKVTLERYQKSYDTPEKMGTLKFSELEIAILSEDFAEVFGRFTLTRDESVGDATGLFTLLMKRTDDGWLVLHDHTSSEN